MKDSGPHQGWCSCGADEEVIPRAWRCRRERNLSGPRRFGQSMGYGVPWKVHRVDHPMIKIGIPELRHRDQCRSLQNIQPRSAALVKEYAGGQGDTSWSPSHPEGNRCLLALAGFSAFRCNPMHSAHLQAVRFVPFLSGEGCWFTRAGRGDAHRQECPSEHTRL